MEGIQDLGLPLFTGPEVSLVSALGELWWWLNPEDVMSAELLKFDQDNVF